MLWWMAAAPALLGGEWAGWCCSYSTGTARLRPVPEAYLSDTAIEWGQIPTGFEELTSEQVVGASVNRRSVRILPEDGCAIEDLPATCLLYTSPSPRD
mgnify:CR=1 FL=1